MELEYSLDYWINKEEEKKNNENTMKYYNTSFMKYNFEFIKSQNYNSLLYNCLFRKKGNILTIEGNLQNNNLWETSSIKKIDIISSIGSINKSDNYLKIITSSNHNYIIPIQSFKSENNMISLHPEYHQEIIYDDYLKNTHFDLEKWSFKKKKKEFIVTGILNENKIISSPINFIVFEEKSLLIITNNNYLYVLDYKKIKGKRTYLKF